MTNEEFLSLADTFRERKNVVNKAMKLAKSYVYNRDTIHESVLWKPEEIANFKEVQDVVNDFCNHKKYAYVDEKSKQRLCFGLGHMIHRMIHDIHAYHWQRLSEGKC